MAAPQDLRERLISIAYCAVLDYYRCFMATDGPNLALIGDDGLTPEIADRIAREYKVRRNISDIADASGQKIPGVEALVDAINQSTWPDSLSERADVCIAIAKGHCDGVERLGLAKVNQTPTSAVTKLMWFRRPEGWTMFDKQARLGLIGNKHCAKTFYARLEKLDFQSIAAGITKLCQDHGFLKL